MKEGEARPLYDPNHCHLASHKGFHSQQSEDEVRPAKPGPAGTWPHKVSIFINDLNVWETRVPSL